MFVASLVLASAGANRVLVIENGLSPASVEIAEDYMKKRGSPIC